jgi:lipopolysaccharide transport system permease protein
MDRTPTIPRDPETWDLVIRSRVGWAELHLGDLWRYRDLIVLFVQRDFTAQFKQTILGPLWFVLQPLLTTLMFSVVFGNIAGLSTDGMPKILFYLSGNIVWQYFSQCLVNTSNSFRLNAGIFGKIYFPRLSVPVSTVISQLIRFALQFLFFAAIWLYYRQRGTEIHCTAAALLLPALVILMAALGLGGGIICSALTTKYRDLQFLLQFGVQLAMYATPVIYPLSTIRGGAARWFILANPMTPIIETFRYGFLGQGTFSWLHLGYSALVTVAALVVGTMLFSRVERDFMDTV